MRGLKARNVGMRGDFVEEEEEKKEEEKEREERKKERIYSRVR